MVNMTHNYVCLRAARWLLKSNKCLCVLLERGNSVTGEEPDAIGFKRGYSVLLEAKATRADFLKDKKKYFRLNNTDALGNERYYICPKGLIKPEEIPSDWGLLYISGKKIYTIVKAPFLEKSLKASRAENNMLANVAVFQNGLILETAFDDIRQEGEATIIKTGAIPENV